VDLGSVEYNELVGVGLREPNSMSKQINAGIAVVALVLSWLATGGSSASINQWIVDASVQPDGDVVNALLDQPPGSFVMSCDQRKANLTEVGFRADGFLNLTGSGGPIDVISQFDDRAEPITTWMVDEQLAMLKGKQAIAFIKKMGGVKQIAFSFPAIDKRLVFMLGEDTTNAIEAISKSCKF
jgi:hypothetical protein